MYTKKLNFDIIAIMNKLSSTLKALMAQQNITTAKLARATKILQPVLHRLVNNQTDNPRIDTLLPIADYFGISINQLIGEAPLIQQPQQQIPLLDDWQNINDYLHGKMPQHTLMMVDANLGDHLFALTVKNATMAPQFNIGSIIIIDPNLTADNSDFVLALTDPDDLPTFRQLLFDDNNIVLKPLNNDFKTIFIEAAGNYKCLGVIVASQTQFKNRGAA